MNTTKKILLLLIILTGCRQELTTSNPSSSSVPFNYLFADANIKVDSVNGSYLHFTNNSTNQLDSTANILINIDTINLTVYQGFKLIGPSGKTSTGNYTQIGYWPMIWYIQLKDSIPGNNYKLQLIKQDNSFVYLPSTWQ